MIAPDKRSKGNEIARKRVLVAEDEMFVAMDIAYALEAAGAEVVGPTSTVREAMAAVEKGDVDAAILDVNLLDGDVTPVLEILLQDDRPVVVNTGAPLPHQIGRIFPDVEVLAKPMDPARLIARIEAQFH